jgi:hypothetical protein
LLGHLLVRPDLRTALEIVARRGFGPEFLGRLRTVGADDSACGRAVRERRRAVIEDVEVDPGYGLIVKRPQPLLRERAGNRL